MSKKDTFDLQETDDQLDKIYRSLKETEGFWKHLTSQDKINSPKRK